MLYRDSWEFLAAVVPFIADGLALKQPVMVAVIGSRIQAIRAALGDAADEVSFVDMSELGQNPARIIPAWQRFVDQNGGGRRPLRGIGEPIWAGRTETEIAECQLHEGLLNLAISPDAALWLICPYDVTALHGAITQHAHASHPVIVDNGKYRGSTTYEGAYYVKNLFGSELPAPPESAEVREFGAAELGDVVNRVLGAAFRAGIAAQRAGSLAMAVRELADDATGGGRAGRATMRLWVSGASVICDIRDNHHTTDPSVGRFEANTRAGRAGLWRANQVCDLIQVRSNENGTTVRVHTRI